MIVTTFLCWVILAACVWLFWPLWYGLIRPRRLEAVPPAGDDATLPLVSIVVPARDEAAAIDAALRSLLALDYPLLEVIAIDDRSRDATGLLMDAVAAGDPRCRVIHVTELPPGWLGKNHANAIGAARAAGEFILFTDGDVMFSPDTLRRAVAHMRDRRVDHLALVPDTLSTTFGEHLVMNYFFMQFATVTRMWLTRHRWARNAFIGIGAFNMLRRAAYERIGGHDALRMEVADDMMLGKLVKDAGLRQDVLAATTLLRVKWQTGIAGTVRGLDKNAFAGARYSVSLVVVAIVVHLALSFGPLALVLLGIARLPAALLLAVVTIGHLGVAVRSHYNIFAALLYPVASLIFCFILIRSTVKTLRAGGVRWRDTFYPLAELRTGMIEWRPIGGILRARRRTF